MSIANIMLIALTVGGFVNSLFTIGTLSVIYFSKMKLSGYTKITIGLTLFQFVDDFSFILPFWCQNNCLNGDISIRFIGDFATDGFTNVLIFLVVCIVTTRMYLGIETKFIPIFIAVAVPSIILGSLTIDSSPELFSLLNYLRIVQVVFNVAGVAIVFVYVSWHSYQSRDHLILLPLREL